MGKRTKRAQLEATAYHEAGNAAMHCHLRVGIRRATIKGGDDYLGRTTGHKFTRRTQENIEFGHGNRVRNIVENDVMCSLAGPLAEHKFTGRRNNIGASDDYRRVVDSLFKRCGSPEEVEAYAKWLEVLATSVATQNVPRVAG